MEGERKKCGDSVPEVEWMRTTINCLKAAEELIEMYEGLFTPFYYKKQIFRQGSAMLIKFVNAKEKFARGRNMRKFCGLKTFPKWRDGDAFSSLDEMQDVDVKIILSEARKRAASRVATSEKAASGAAGSGGEMKRPKMVIAKGKEDESEPLCSKSLVGEGKEKEKEEEAHLKEEILELVEGIDWTDFGNMEDLERKDPDEDKGIEGKDSGMGGTTPTVSDETTATVSDETTPAVSDEITPTVSDETCNLSISETESFKGKAMEEDEGFASQA